MSTLEEIKSAIESLAPERLRDLEEWIIKRRLDLWDHQMIEDIEAGRLQPLLEQLNSEIATGEFTDGFKPV